MHARAQAKQDVCEEEVYEVKFKWVGPPVDVLETQLVLLKVPAAPATWQLSLTEVGRLSQRASLVVVTHCLIRALDDDPPAAGDLHEAKHAVHSCCDALEGLL